MSSVPYGKFSTKFVVNSKIHLADIVLKVFKFRLILSMNLVESLSTDFGCPFIRLNSMIMKYFKWKFQLKLTRLMINNLLFSSQRR